MGKRPILCRMLLLFTADSSLLRWLGADIQQVERALTTTERGHHIGLFETPAVIKKVDYIIHPKQSVGMAAAASVWTGQGIKYYFCGGGHQGRAGGSKISAMREEHKKDGLTRAALAGRIHHRWRGNGRRVLLCSAFTCGSPGC